MRADGREGDGLCLRLSSTAIGSAAYGHRLQPRQDLSGLMGRILRCRGLRRRGAGGTGGHGGRWHPADPLRAEAAIGRSSSAQGDPGDLVRDVLRHAMARHWPALPFGTLYTLFARWTRLWRRLLNRLIQAWRQACGDTADPSAVIIDSRSCRSAPTCFTRGFDGGKKIKGSISLWTSTVSRWRSPSRRRMSMTAKVSSRCCVNLPAAASKEQLWAISAIAASACPKPARRSASPSNPAPTAEPSFQRGVGSSAPWPGSAATVS